MESKKMSGTEAKANYLRQLGAIKIQCAAARDRGLANAALACEVLAGIESEFQGRTDAQWESPDGPVIVGEILRARVSARLKG
jgi:hypothetical protein